MERIQKNKKKTVTGILLAAVVVTVMFAAYVLGQRSVENTNTNGIAIDENVSDWDGSLKNVAGNESTGIKIPGYGQLTVDAGEKDWNITLVNPKDNNCYFQFDTLTFFHFLLLIEILNNYCLIPSQQFLFFLWIP